MIEFDYQTDFNLDKAEMVRSWIEEIIGCEGFEVGDISYIFCDDDYLHGINLEFLQHDTFTDIISFDYGLGKQINGEIYISVDRVLENSNKYQTSFGKELCRVIVHGILHLCGYKDKLYEEALLMRRKEDEALEKLPVQFFN